MIFRKKTKGFTLVELVIVIAVIAVLAAVLIPTFSSVIDAANNSVVQQDLRNAYVQYVTEEAPRGDALPREDVILMKIGEDDKYYKFENEKYVVKTLYELLPDETAGSVIEISSANYYGYKLMKLQLSASSDPQQTTYTITFKNGDEVLQSGKVAEDETPIYEGQTPSKEAELVGKQKWTYTFTGWDKTVSPATEDATYTAQFSPSSVLYEITEGDSITTDSIIEMGSYPQARATALESTLTGSYATNLPTSENANGWISYKYYISGSNETDYMWYKDVEHEGNKYRAVYFTQYRPTEIKDPSTIEKSTQDDNGYAPGQVYWFKFEPLEWKVLSVNGTAATLICTSIIDSQHFYNNRNPHASAALANDYKESDINTWLNDTFYNLAFASTEQGIILNSKIDYKGISGTSDDIDAKVYLLSKGEVDDTNLFKDDNARIRNLTEYSLSQGGQNNGAWWLRTPLSSDNGAAFHCSNTPAYYVDRVEGIVPAIQITY